MALCIDSMRLCPLPKGFLSFFVIEVFVLRNDLIDMQIFTFLFCPPHEFVCHIYEGIVNCGKKRQQVIEGNKIFENVKICTVSLELL